MGYWNWLRQGIKESISDMPKTLSKTVFHPFIEYFSGAIIAWIFVCICIYHFALSSWAWAFYTFILTIIGCLLCTHGWYRHK